ncbi:hypothetical protein SAMN03159496_04201 [Rhizobium sp. NFR07]|uniref:hypothetical protein n=1 Tax=Rhizobium sp. NFR07 TaxID=1566262 RepID=UPI0008EF445C|nr:hypothetical protein [Rhizobium sp. NFR07]SFB48660.1 hypothetical protein SAMN03159496_04201 [Rhizobium sp. NFR07]
MTLVHNERTKLLANSLDRLSTACVAAGFIAPAVSLSNGAMSFSISLSTAISTVAWLLGALILHLSARRALGGLIS